MDSVAITDHGAMYGVINFYEEAIAAGIKPIIGCEVYVTQNRKDRTRGEKSNNHLVLLAKDIDGYRNLMKLVSIGFVEGFYYKPRIDYEVLSQYSNGLIGMSACIAGKIPRIILKDEYDNAVQASVELNDIFGSGNFYLELQDNGITEQKKVNEGLLKISKQTGIPLVATNDVHYINKTDSQTHDILLCIQTGSTFDEKKRMKFDSEEFYLKSYEEMEELFRDTPEALKNSLEIAEKCNLEIKLGDTNLPSFDVPDGSSLDDYLKKLCLDNLQAKYPDANQEIMQRFNYELDVITKMGFSGYFLIVQDFVNFAKQNEIGVGPGRGSAAGSIISYLLNITEVDPIKYNLIFERFLNPERKEMPDIDIDFEHARRVEVIDYVASKYGQEKVAQIITFSKMMARAAVRDAGRVLGFPYAKPDKIAKLIDAFSTIDESLKQNSDFKNLYETDPDSKQIIDAALGIEGLVRQDSIHAAGVVISPEEITNYSPVQKEDEAETVTQFNMDDIKKIGLLKMDFLGLRTIDTIKKAVELIKATAKVEVDIANIPLDDARTFELLRDAKTVGIFQLGKSGMRALLKEMKPTLFTDIIALVALFRPGPLGSGMHKEFVARKHGKRKIEYPHKSLDQILKETYGIIVYQEQVMQIAAELAGYSMAEADLLRKAMGKKIPQILKEQKIKFVNGSVEKNVPKQTAEKIFSLIEHFGEYGFNKSHSAAYALLAYQTSYLKANYTAEFMAALLSTESETKDKVTQFVQECRSLGIEVLPPDVNESLNDFTISNGVIRFGLSAVRNIGEALVDKIIKARQAGPFLDIFDFCKRLDSRSLNKRSIESLIKAGAFDSFGFTRNALLCGYQKAVDAAARHQKDASSGQFNLFGEQSEVTSSNEQLENLPEMEKDKLLAEEKEMLGLYITDHPLFGLENALKKYSTCPISELREMRDGSTQVISGMISKITWKLTKNGDKMAYVDIEDLESSVETIVFPKIVSDKLDLLEEDKLIVVKGRLDIKEDSLKMVAQNIAPLETGSSDNNEEFKSSLLNVTHVKAGGNGENNSDNPEILKITLPANNSTSQILDNLRKILKKHRGNCGVIVEIPSNGETAKLRLSDIYSVEINNNLLDELKTVLPRHNVDVRR